MSFYQLTQHGIIRYMRNNIHKYLQVLEQTKEATFQNNLPGASTGLRTKKHMKQPFKTICLVLPQDLEKGKKPRSDL